MCIRDRILGAYEFTKHKSDENNKQTDLFLHFNQDEISEVNKVISDARIISNAVNLCRNFANEPSNILTPTK